MQKRKVLFNEFVIPVPKGFEQTIDKDEKTEYLFLKAPKNKYTLYFDSGMPIYDQSILNNSKETGTMELKFKDRKISLYCPTRVGDNDGIWFFKVEFDSKDDEGLILSGQIILNSVKGFQNLVNKRNSFIEVLEKVELKK